MEAAAAAGVQLGTSKPQIATQAEMSEARLPLPYRDQCAHLLIPLNKSRVAEYYLPWKCEPERHAYEKCQYELVMERMIQMQKIREAQEAKSKGAATIGVPLIPSTAKLSWSPLRFDLLYSGDRPPRLVILAPLDLARLLWLASWLRFQRKFYPSESDEHYWWTFRL